MLNTNCIYSPIWNCMSQNKNRTVILSKKWIVVIKLMEIKFSIFLNFFDVISIFFRCFFDVFIRCFVFLYYAFSIFLLFDILSFYVSS